MKGETVALEQKPRVFFTEALWIAKPTNKHRQNNIIWNK